VAEGFRAIAAAEPGRCVVVNADGSADAVADRIFAIVKERFL
jgi:thymidylate kinase